MLTVIYGGSGSGKSEYAESLVCSLEGKQRLYIATMVPFGNEGRQKIDRHQSMRKEKNFQTIECYTNLRGIELFSSIKGSVVLLECMSNLVANEMYRDTGAKESTVQAVMSGITKLCSQAKHVIVVTNDVFCDGQIYSDESMLYLSYLSKINSQISSMAGCLIEVVSGLPIVHKRIDNIMVEMNKQEGHQLELVIGGRKQGKQDFVIESMGIEKNEITQGKDCNIDCLGEEKYINDYHLIIKRVMESNRNPMEFTKELLNQKMDRIIICDEIGCGLVPIDSFERDYRETVGRVCCYLGKVAHKVTRMVCSIPSEIKNSNIEDIANRSIFEREEKNNEGCIFLFNP